MAPDDAVDVCLSFDTTGSMFPCLTQVRREAVATVKRLFRDIPRLRIAIIAHGDYCDAGSSYVTKTFNFSSDEARICDFIRNVGATGGGDAPECYELVLNEALALGWRAGSRKVLVMIGDDVPHPPTYPLNKKRIDWRNELRLLLEAGIHVYGVHAMPGIRQHSRSFYQEIARTTEGVYLTLDQFSAINDIIFAICYRQSGTDRLRQFQQEVQRGRRMTRNMANVFQTLGGDRVEMGSRPGLIPVPAGRFQILEVDAHGEAKIPIKQFVTEQGLAFKKGRGFYHFNGRAELIQETKEVVLRDKATGDMFTGAEAREMIGLPLGQRGTLKPVMFEEFDVFVRSDSSNRGLVDGALFLFEVEDWDRKH